MSATHLISTLGLMTSCGIEAEGKAATHDVEDVTCRRCQQTELYYRHRRDRWQRVNG